MSSKVSLPVGKRSSGTATYVIGGQNLTRKPKPITIQGNYPLGYLEQKASVTAAIVFEPLETPMKHEARVFESTSPTKENVMLKLCDCN